MKFVLYLTALLLCISPASAEVRESEFGRDEGYPYEMGWPFRTTPKLRHGALTGKGLVQSQKSAHPFWIPAVTPASVLPKAAPSFLLEADAKNLMARNTIMAMLLIKNGAVVFERYQYGTAADTLFDGQSIAKTLTALSVGALVDDGLLKSTALRMSDLIPSLRDSPIGLATVRQALQMQCGHQFKWEDAGADASAGKYAGVKFAAQASGRSRDLYAYFKTLPPTPTGSKFSYDPHCSDALSMLVTQLTGKNLRQYFESRVWQRLGPENRAAWLSPVNHPELTSGANTFYASLRDYARIALMFVDEGRANHAQVLSADWMHLMHTDVVEVGDYPSNFKRYGYQTWVRDKTPDSWFAGLGNYGQRFYIDSKRKNAMILFALDESHIKESDLFWERFKR